MSGWMRGDGGGGGHMRKKPWTVVAVKASLDRTRRHRRRRTHTNCCTRFRHIRSKYDAKSICLLFTHSVLFVKHQQQALPLHFTSLFYDLLDIADDRRSDVIVKTNTSIFALLLHIRGTIVVRLKPQNNINNQSVMRGCSQFFQKFFLQTLVNGKQCQGEMIW